MVELWNALRLGPAVGRVELWNALVFVQAVAVQVPRQLQAAAC